MFIIPEEQIICILYIFPEFRIKINIVINRNKHRLYSAFRESISIPRRKKVYSLITVNSCCKFVISYVPVNYSLFDIAAVSLLKNYKIRMILSGKSPVCHPLYRLVLKFSGKSRILSRNPRKFFPCSFIKLVCLLTTFVCFARNSRSCKNNSCRSCCKSLKFYHKPVPFLSLPANHCTARFLLLTYMLYPLIEYSFNMSVCQ